MVSAVRQVLPDPYNIFRQAPSVRKLLRQQASDQLRAVLANPNGEFLLSIQPSGKILQPLAARRSVINPVTAFDVRMAFSKGAIA